MSEALRLADLVEHDPLAYSDDAAAELRRLSAELAALKAAIEAQGVPDGWQLVPKQPTAKMIGNGRRSVYVESSYSMCDVGGDAVSAVWSAMLASAPPAPQAEIVEATQPHPTNNYLFKLLCEKAGIVLGVDRVDTACEKVARMSLCVDSKCPNYWDDAYDDLKPGDIETDCEPAPQEVVEHQSALIGEAQELSKILAGMGEGSYDLETLYTTDQADGDAFVRRAADLLVEMASAPPAPQAEQHPDDAAVDRFAAAMKDKLAIARQKGRGGWETCSAEDLGRMLREHVEKGDPRDVANFCMFLWSLGHGIAPQASGVQQGPVAWIRPSGKAMLEAGGYCTVYASEGMSNHSTPLYTHPAQQAKPKPITEQELKAGREAVTDDPDEQPDPWSFRMGAWFAERHHGIKE